MKIDNASNLMTPQYRLSYLLLDEVLMLAVEQVRRSEDVLGVRSHRWPFYTHLMSEASATASPLLLKSNDSTLISPVNNSI